MSDPDVDKPRDSGSTVFILAPVWLLCYDLVVNSCFTIEDGFAFCEPNGWTGIFHFFVHFIVVQFRKTLMAASLWLDSALISSLLLSRFMKYEIFIVHRRGLKVYSNY